MKDIYLRLSKLIGAMSSTTIDADSQNLLDIIALAHQEGKPLTVTQLISHKDIASSATLHRRLQRLISLGYVTMETHEEARRAKFLVPTTKAEEHFKQLGEYVIQATKG
jgi:DNA-binding MarR family transcriptional regulator